MGVIKSKKPVEVPGKLISKFRVTNKQLFFAAKLRNIQFKERVIGPLPNVPAPSKKIRDLLLEFNSLSDPASSQISSKSKRTKKPKTGKLNGFIAFRIFYCKSISNPEHQRKLSGLLAKIWLTEAHKEYWNRYAQGYNLREEKDVPFVEWLCDELNMNQPDMQHKNTHLLKIKKNKIWSFQPNQSNAVEDVYLTRL